MIAPKEKAEELVDNYNGLAHSDFHMQTGYDESQRFENAKQCALIAVNYIIASNPHSNPFNTEVYSTMGYWLKVKGEIELL